MKKIIAKIFSPWGLVPLIMALLCNFAVYSGCNALTRNWNLHSLAIPLDKQIPLIPWTIVIYFGCYIFWIINYILIYRRSREYAYRFFCCRFFITNCVSCVFFMLSDYAGTSRCRRGGDFLWCHSFSLQNRCANKSFSIHSLSCQLVLLYRYYKWHKNSKMV